MIAVAVVIVPLFVYCGVGCCQNGLTRRGTDREGEGALLYLIGCALILAAFVVTVRACAPA